MEQSVWELLSICSDGLLLVDAAQENIVEKNAAFLRWAGVTADALEDASLAEVFAEFGAGPGRAALLSVVQGECPEALVELAAPGADAGNRSVGAILRRIDDGDRPLVAVVVPAARIKSQSGIVPPDRRDPLTNLADRTLLLEELNAPSSAGYQRDGRLALLFIDLDDFKRVNDRWGHLVGDEVLHEVAQRLATSLRSEDTLVRYGGDEFVAVVRSTVAPLDHQTVVQRMQRVLRPPIMVSNGEQITVTASIGVASSSGTSTTAAQLIALADSDMYRAKRQSAAETHV